jgi:hypothetical protein
MEYKLDLPKPLKVDKNILKYIDDLEKKGSNITSFLGSPEIGTMFQLYLLKKYKSKCIPQSLRVIGDPIFFGISVNLKLKFNKIEEKIILERFLYLSENIVNCVKNGEKTIVIPLNFFRGKDGHANMLIYRTTTSELERFEPHGNDYMGDELQYNRVNDRIKQILVLFTKILNFQLKKENINEVKLIDSSQVCPYLEGLQSFEEKSSLKKFRKEGGGYCLAWSMFFMELCLRNPDLSSRDILTNIYNYLTVKKDTNDYLKRVIRGYSGYIYETFEKYLSVFFKRKLTVDDIIEMTIKGDKQRLDKISEVLDVLILLEMKIMSDPEFNLKVELKNTKKELYNLTKGKPKEEIKRTISLNPKLRYLYFKKRILQNFEEYNNYDKVTSPILDSPLEINKNDIINFNLLKKKIINNPTIEENKLLTEKNEDKKRQKKTKKTSNLLKNKTLKNTKL